MVLYALVSDASIGYLFLGGVVPGPADGPSSRWASSPSRRAARISRSRSRCRCASCRASPGRPSGPDDAGGAAGRHLWRRHHADRGGRGRGCLCPARLDRPLSQRQRSASFYRSLLSSARTTASIGMLIAGALVFNYVVTVENIPRQPAAAPRPVGTRPGHLPDPRQCHPAAARLRARGHDDPADHRAGASSRPRRRSASTWCISAWWCVVNIMIGLITPPYGLLLFIMTRHLGRAAARTSCADVCPFLFAMIAALALITFVPETRALAAAAVRLSGLATTA